MKLRGRFTVTLALAALVPISVAAFVTTRAATRFGRRTSASMSSVILRPAHTATT